MFQNLLPTSIFSSRRESTLMLRVSSCAIFLWWISRITFKRSQYQAHRFRCCNLNLQFRQFYFPYKILFFFFFLLFYNWNSYKRKSFHIMLLNLRSAFFVRILFCLSTGSWIIISIHCLALLQFFIISIYDIELQKTEDTQQCVF